MRHSRCPAGPTDHVQQWGMQMATAHTKRFAFAALIAALPLAGASADEPYPSRPVRIMVSFSAGGPTDIVARVMAARMGELPGQQFVVENKAGAGGNIGADMVAKSP